MRAWCPPQVGLPQTGPSTTTSRRRLSILVIGRSRSRTKTFMDTRPPASRQTEQQQTPRTNPDWPRLLQAARWWPRTSSGRPHRQLREAGGKGSQRRRRRRTRNTSGVKTKRLDDGMHENGTPAIGPDCERISASSVGEKGGHTTTSLKRTSID